jgi:hypothetical protein
MSKKSETARINGAKSHGPSTPEGRAKSSRNSLRHGLSAKSIVLPNEDADEYQQLLDAHIDQFHPRTGVEMELVEAMAVARWRLRRIRTIETNLFTTELDRYQEDLESEPEYKTADDRLAYVFKKLADNSQSLAMLVRYEATLTRSYDRAFKQLQTLQRQNEPKPAPALALVSPVVTHVAPSTSRSEPSPPASLGLSDPSGSRTVDPTPSTSTSPPAQAQESDPRPRTDAPA